MSSNLAYDSHEIILIIKHSLLKIKGRDQYENIPAFKVNWGTDSDTNRKKLASTGRNSLGTH